MYPDLVIAFALVLVIEGLLYALFPDAMKRMMESVMSMPSSSIRSAGLLSAIVGVGIVWSIRL
jgi:uncharacterized protein YjeT (DUF2065 family)